MLTRWCVYLCVASERGVCLCEAGSATMHGISGGRGRRCTMYSSNKEAKSVMKKGAERHANMTACPHNLQSVPSTLLTAYVTMQSGGGGRQMIT